MKYNLFIGRFQSPHKGHQALFDTYLKENQPVLIAIRDVEPDKNNPLSAVQVESLWNEIYGDNTLVKIVIFPDICSVNYGREVGYAVNELNMPKEVLSISASEIRNQILEGKEDWKLQVDEKIHQKLERMIKNSSFCKS